MHVMAILQQLFSSYEQNKTGKNIIDVSSQRFDLRNLKLTLSAFRTFHKPDLRACFRSGYLSYECFSHDSLWQNWKNADELSMFDGVGSQHNHFDELSIGFRAWQGAFFKSCCFWKRRFSISVPSKRKLSIMPRVFHKLWCFEMLKHALFFGLLL